MASSPFFSVGITTYRRHEPLRKAVQSVLASTFADLEIIVGNDFQGETLTADVIGISDPRVRVLNHPVNLREIGNMNAMLRAGRGRYFTWLADDDFCSPYFFERVKAAIDGAGQPHVVFTSYDSVTELPDAATLDQHRTTGPTRALGAAAFLADVLTHRRKAMGFCGVFTMEYLQQIGGVEPIVESAPVGLYSEYLMLVKAAAHGPAIPYVDAPLTFYNEHQGSWGISNRDVELYREAGPALVRKAMPFLSAPVLRGELRDCLLRLLILAFDNYYVKYGAINRFLDEPAAHAYVQALADACGEHRADPAVADAFRRFELHVRWSRLKSGVRRALPSPMPHLAERLYGRGLKLAQALRALRRAHLVT